MRRQELVGDVKLNLRGNVIPVAAGSNFAYNESTVIPLGIVGGILLLLSGAKHNRLDRSEAVLGWCVEQHKAKEPKSLTRDETA